MKKKDFLSKIHIFIGLVLFSIFLNGSVALAKKSPAPLCEKHQHVCRKEQMNWEAAELVSTLREELAKFNLKNPEAEARNNLSLRKNHFIGLYGYSTYYPGVADADLHYVKEMGADIIKGTSDVIISKEHENLIKKARRYAQVYNATLIKIIKVRAARCDPLKEYWDLLGHPFTQAFGMKGFILDKNFIIEEPLGIARGIHGNRNSDNIHLYLGTRRDSLPMFNKKLGVSDFKHKLVKGIAIRRDDFWCAKGNITSYYHVNTKWADQK